MATDALARKRSQKISANVVDAKATPWEIVKAVFMPLASLKLTVILLGLAAVEVLLGTLAQDKLDMWEVMSEYFRAWFTWVELRMLFPDAWFPSKPFADTRLGFPFPGGLLIGSLMAVNLISAHSMRFKIQASGSRLWAGSGVIAAGLFLTWLVIASGHRQEGLQGVPVFDDWKALWLPVKLSLAVACMASGAWLASLLARKTAQSSQRIVAGSLCGLFGLTFLFLLVGGDALYLGDSGMRILWQLIQGGVSGLILLVGCVMVFRRRGGIVLIHTGIGLMMGYELFVGTYAIEERMTVREGEETSQASDIRDVELAVIDSSRDDENVITIIPISTQGIPTRFLNQRRIEHPELPFHIEILEYYKNTRQPSRPRRLKPNEKSLASDGFGSVYHLAKKRPVTGADGDEINYATIFAKFIDKKSSQDIGSYAISQIMPFYGHTESVKVGGKQYELDLRFKVTEKPYSIHAKDVRREDYLGTNTPKDYSSFITLKDPQRDVEFGTRIWMNNPMRYNGETFYQSGYNEVNGTEITTLQVVTNTGWMAPYVGCMLVVTGLLAHFYGVLIRFLNRMTTGQVMSVTAGAGRHVRERDTKQLSAPVMAVPSLSAPAASPLVGWLFPLGVLVFFALFLMYSAWPRSTPDGQMKLDEFGKLPVVYEGRAKPYDTLARNSLRVISGRETFVDEEGNRQPAIRWLLDVITNSEQSKNHKVFRIESLDVLQTLGVQPRSRFRYAYAEFESQLPAVEEQIAKAMKTEKEDLNLYQKKLADLNIRLRLFDALRFSHQIPAEELGPLDQVNIFWRCRGLLEGGNTPYGAPTDSSEMPWEPLSAAAVRMWIPQLMQTTGVTSEIELAANLADRAMKDNDNDELRRLIQNQRVNTIKDILMRQDGTMTDEELDEHVEKSLKFMPSELRGTLEESARIQLQENLGISAWMGIKAVQEITDGKTKIHPVADALRHLLIAYKEGNVNEFNRSLDVYRKAVVANPPQQISWFKIDLETEYNRLEAFYNCNIMYFFVGIMTFFAWLTWLVGWNRPLNRAAFLLALLAFALHTAALVARIYISGRPPVTNLYSSAIFIGWACVLSGLAIEIFFRLGVGNILSAVAGFSTLVIAQNLAGDGDTMKVLQAVLDTTFWLSTHVVCITLGYAATFLAGLLGTCYILLGLCTKLLSHKVGKLTLGKVIANMVYGVVCFAIFFSFYGTVLGGLWADDSWGRFWGWDPKENGALIIVLWNALVLHARWDGLVKDRGLAVLVIGGNIVTSWSWFGVNQLGIGLHSYGFTQGVLKALAIYVASQIALIGIGMLPKEHWRSFQQPDPTDGAQMT